MHIKQGVWWRFNSPLEVRAGEYAEFVQEDGVWKVYHHTEEGTKVIVLRETDTPNLYESD